jgi:hypothetical protein
MGRSKGWSSREGNPSPPYPPLEGEGSYVLRLPHCFTHYPLRGEGLHDWMPGMECAAAELGLQSPNDA